MTDNEKLIEEAAEAMLDAARELLGVETIGERPREMTREYARRAFAVFEKAHTPTGDEREAQGWREAAMYDGDAQTQDDFMTGWRTADRLRRSEVPEPLFPDQSIAEAVEIMREAETHRTTRPEQQGEPSAAQVAEIEQRVYDQHRGQIAGMAKALVRAGWDAAVEGQR